jgi:hypothetical protein
MELSSLCTFVKIIEAIKVLIGKINICIQKIKKFFEILNSYKDCKKKCQLRGFKSNYCKKVCKVNLKWKFLNFDKNGDAWFYNPENKSKNQIQVKVIPSEKENKDLKELFKNKDVDYYEVRSYKINCFKKEFQILGIEIHDSTGKILYSDSKNNWALPIDDIPDSVREILLKKNMPS